jgi:hypothetical protein
VRRSGCLRVSVSGRRGRNADVFALSSTPSIRRVRGVAKAEAERRAATAAYRRAEEEQQAGRPAHAHSSLLKAEEAELRAERYEAQAEHARAQVKRLQADLKKAGGRKVGNWLGRAANALVVGDAPDPAGNVH